MSVTSPPKSFPRQQRRAFRLFCRGNRVFAALMLLAAFCATSASRATTVVPPTFDELVDLSQFVFRGQVSDVQVVWSGIGTKRHLATEVTFEIGRILKGAAAGPTLTLEFLGGERDGHRLHVVGMPHFTVGDRGVFFVDDPNNHLCPLLRLRHGRYRIVHDATTDTDVVQRDDRSPLTTPSGVAQPLGEARAFSTSTPAGAALSLREFESAIRSRLAQGSSEARQP